MRQQAFQTSHWQAMAALWRQQLLCDVQLRASSGELFAAHSVVLASASGFFRALLCGAGRSMRECCRAGVGPTQQQPTVDTGTMSAAGPASPATGCSGASASSPSGHLIVDLPYSGHQLSALLAVVYDHTLEVCAHNVSWLLDMAAYLEVMPLQEACCEFLRSGLGSDASVDVVLLAHHYHCTQLQSEGVECLAKRLLSLLLLPEARQSLLRLPQPLLCELLSSEALEVDQESELLCFIADWVNHAPADRQQHLPQLLALLKLSALPQEQLSQQQLQACSGSAAAALARELYQAAQTCQAAQHQHQLQQQQQQPRLQAMHQLQRPQQQQQQQPQLQQLQQHVGRRQAGQAVADVTEAGRCLAGNNACSPAHVSEGSSSGPSDVVADAGQQSDACCWPTAVSSADDQNNASSSSHLRDSRSAATAGAAAAGLSSGGGPLACSSSSSSDNNAAMLTSSMHGCISSGVGDDLLLDCFDAGSIGAVVAQAWPGRQRGFQPTSILVAGGHDPSWRGLRPVELYDPLADSWTWGPMLPMALPFAGAGVPTKGQVYVIGGAMCSNYMARLDVVNEEWHNCEGPALSRLHAGVTGSAGLLYVTGGRTQVNVVVSAVEAYDHARAAWQSLPDMLQPRYAHGVVAQGGCLYALGGQACKAIHRTIEVFDPHRGSWQALGAQLSSERKYCAAASLGGRLLVLGGMNEARRRLSTVEAYDPREGRWSDLTSMQHARSSCSVACLGGRLYVMGGNAGTEQLHGSVEVFDPLTGAWSSCAPLSCGRSGLSAVSV